MTKNKSLYKTLADPKSERELLLLCDTILRGEKKDLDDSEKARKTLSHGRSELQPDSKKQTVLGET